MCHLWIRGHSQTTLKSKRQSSKCERLYYIILLILSYIVNISTKGGHSKIFKILTTKWNGWSLDNTKPTPPARTIGRMIQKGLLNDPWSRMFATPKRPLWNWKRGFILLMVWWYRKWVWKVMHEFDRGKVIKASTWLLSCHRHNVHRVKTRQNNRIARFTKRCHYFQRTGSYYLVHIYDMLIMH